MIQTINRVQYRAFGLQITSEIALPELTSAQFEQEQADMEIIVRDLGDRWQQSIKYQRYYGVQGDCVLMYVPNVAIFGISQGKCIEVSPFEGAGSDIIRLYLLGTCMGLVLTQRGLLALHGSAVVIDGKAYAFVGDSGAGKSTLAACFINRGHRLVSDDVIPVDLSEKGPVIIPGYPQQKLWQESLDGLGMAGEYKPLYDRETKFAVPVPQAFHQEKIELAGVFELIKQEDQAVTLEEISGLERIHVLMYQTFRGNLIPAMKREQWHFDSCARLAQRLPVYRIRRPVHAFTVSDIADRVLQTISMR